MESLLTIFGVLTLLFLWQITRRLRDIFNMLCNIYTDSTTRIDQD